MALTIAAACRCNAVLPDVLDCLADPNNGDVHSPAAAAIPALSRRRDAARLLALVQQPAPGGAARLVRFGCAIALLETKHWTLREVIPHLPALVNSRITDGYILAQYCAPCDVRFILSKAPKWPGAFDIGSIHYGFTKAAFLGALPRWHVSAVRTGLARLWLAAAATRGLPDDFAKALRQRGQVDEVGRCDFIEAVAALRVFQGIELHFFIGGLVVEADLKWLLQRVRHVRGVARQNIVAVVGALYRVERGAEFLDDLLEACRALPAMQRKFAWLRSWRLDEPIAVEAKQHYEKSRAAAAQRARTAIAPEVVWNRDLRVLETGSPTAWIGTSDNLFYTGENQSLSALQSDVTLAPGWKFHSAAARKTFLEAARRMLMHQKGETDISPNQLSAMGIGGYRAIVLLRRDQALRTTVRRHWIPTILNWFGSDDARAMDLVRFAYRLDRQRALSFLGRELAQGAVSEGGHMLCVRKYARSWDGKLGEHIAGWVMRYPQLRPRVLASLMRELIMISDGTAWRLWVRILRSQSFASDRKAAVLGAWLEARIWESWNKVKDTLGDTALAREAFLEAATNYNLESRKLRKRPSAQAMADVYLLLRTLFPIVEDEPAPSHTFTPTRRMDVAQWRGSLPQAVAAQASLSACRALERMAAQSTGNERSWILMRLHDAIQGKRRRDWVPLAPEDLRQVLSTRKNGGSTAAVP